MAHCGTYCGTAVVKVYSGIQYTQLGFASDALYGAFLQGTLIPQAEQLIDSYCNHDFCVHSAGTITVDGTGKDYVIIPPTYAPLRGTITSVSIGGVAKTVSDFKAYSQYIVYDGGTFTEDPQNVVIVTDYGYSSVPDDIAYVCAQISANMLRETVRSKMMPDLIVPLLEAEGARALGAVLASPRVFTKELRDMLRKYVFHQIEVG